MTTKIPGSPKKYFVSGGMALLFAVQVSAQNTYDIVYNLFQAKCTSCHGSTTKQGQLDLSAAKGTVYTAIVGKDPVNPAAKAKGDKLVSPGDPHRSFLMRKCNNGLDPDNGLQAAEGQTMPTIAPLAKNEIEIIRQWILYGAKQTGIAVDTTIINTYYRGKGKDLTVKLTPPPADSGFQIHFGPVFIAPKGEFENYSKFNPALPDTTEVTRLDLKMNKKASHHFLLYKFDVGAEKNVADGLRPVLQSCNCQLVNPWASSGNMVLPPKTAYSWPKGSFLDLDFHCFNTSADSVVLTDVRINIYTQQKKKAEAIMHSGLYHNFNIPTPAGSTKTFTAAVTFDKYLPPNTEKMYVYILSSHTHKYGKDYDIYERTPAGDKGQLLYEGEYNFDYTFKQGYYDWEHPALRTFYPFLPLDPKAGLIHEAKYENYGTKDVGFGLTTNDEMMLMYVQFTLKDVSNPQGIKNSLVQKNNSLRIYPNPYTGSTSISYILESKANVQAEIYNMLGEKLGTLVNGIQQAGTYQHSFSAREAGHPPGIYLVKLNINGEVSSQRLVELK